MRRNNFLRCRTALAVTPLKHTGGETSKCKSRVFKVPIKMALNALVSVPPSAWASAFH